MRLKGRSRFNQLTAEQQAAIMNKSSDPSQAFLEVYEGLLQVKALVVASDPDADPAELHELTATIARLRKQTLAKRKQLHAEKTQNNPQFRINL